MSLLDPARYASEGYPHAEWTELRRSAPIHRINPQRGDPYWALTRHADVVAVSRQPERFRNWPRFKASEGAEAFAATPTLITMDPPRHARYRRLVSARFTPHALRSAELDIERIAGQVLDDWIRDCPGGTCDFVSSVAAPLPIAVIAQMMGLPRTEWPQLFRLTNATIGAFDPEYVAPGESVEQAVRRSQRELLEYFAAIAEERRHNPADDLISLLAQARVEGRPLGREELLSYCLILVVAGNETTRNAISGGLLAFLEHEEQWERLKRDESLLEPAVEEILRWATPVIHMARTASEDTELRGVRIAKGDLLALFYPSANRDEEVFDAPFAFRIDRHPNRHLSFGIGEHFCLGAHLARRELRAIYRQLARRLRRAELAGPVERLASPNVGGIKRLPLRFELEAASA